MNQFLKPTEVARHLQIDVKTVYKLIDTGQLRGVKLGPKTTRIDPDSLPTGGRSCSRFEGSSRALFCLLNWAIAAGDIAVIREANRLSKQMGSIVSRSVGQSDQQSKLDVASLLGAVRLFCHADPTGVCAAACGRYGVDRELMQCYAPA